MKLFSKQRGAPLGQHLLTSRSIAREVALAVQVSPGELVLEVGPGKGMLTKELLALGARVHAIEKDPEMVRVLTRECADAIESGALTVTEGDARDLLNAESSMLNTQYKVVANIPYYITGELIRLFLTASRQPSAVSLLVQKEVAERVARDKKESLLSLSVKAYGTPQFVKTVRAGSFNPPPSVDSAILAIHDISRKNFEAVPEDAFFELLHIGFGQKRKTLSGNLKRAGFDGALIKEIFEKRGLSLQMRAEDVPLVEWLELARSLNGARAVKEKEDWKPGAKRRP